MLISLGLWVVLNVPKCHNRKKMMVKPNLRILAISQLTNLLMALPPTQGGPGLHRTFAGLRSRNKHTGCWLPVGQDYLQCTAAGIALCKTRCQVPAGEVCSEAWKLNFVSLSSIRSSDCWEDICSEERHVAW